MPTLYLVRHGLAASAWDREIDPGLDALGREQAASLVRELNSLAPVDLIVSPLARTRETAAPLAAAWQVEPRIEPRVGEIPSPVSGLAERGLWLREVATRAWPQMGKPLRQWRGQVLMALAEIEGDAVVVSHYIAINAAVGAAVGDDRVVHFHPDHCSVTVLRSGAGRFELVRRGAEAATRVL
ncbi:MAG TPA: histidine phosphatase family protein [Xanthobacteraceae bacterium]|nr:histidine phosphatase family protein [Xanthobacteraceae bacterium]